MNKLLHLKIANFRSFFDEQILHFDNKINTNITAIYGPNASGKSNTARALSFIKWFLQNSTDARIFKIPFEPFLLRADNTLPTSFGIKFISGDRKFRYDFAFNLDEVVSEELRELTTQKEKVIFRRDHQQITNVATAKKFGFTDSLMKKTLKTSLLITKAREDNNEYANAIFDFIMNLNVITSGTPELRNISVNLLRTDPTIKQKVLEFLKNADIWIRDLAINEIDTPDEIINGLPFNEETKNYMRGQKSVSITTEHGMRNADKKIVGRVQFSIDDQESAGTNVIFDLSALIIYSIEKGAPLYIDEFGLHLHSDICKYILNRFRNNQAAQLILNTHDTSLMDNLKREEIVFVDKNQAEESIIAPLMNMSPRKGEPLEKRYKQGLYGAKPFIRETK